MDFPPLQKARLLRRYKRFLADVEIEGQAPRTVLVPNTGSMLGLNTPGCEVWLRPAGRPGLKYEQVLTLVRSGRGLVCVDTSLANHLVLDAARAQELPELAGYFEYIPEVPLGSGSRIDLCCRVHRKDMLRRCYVEVKSVTLARGRQAQWPDCVSLRGRKHLSELQEAAAAGDQAVQLFLVQRGDCDSFGPAADIDPAYAAALHEAAAAGVKICAYQAAVTKRGIQIQRPLPVEL